jgi:hypothetical protein
MFTQAKRETPVYFHYAYQCVDQVSITYPQAVTVESMPKQDQIAMMKLAAMRLDSQNKGNTLTVTRTFALAEIIFKPDEYDQLRAFYSKVGSKDQEQTILKVAAHAQGN